MLFFITHGLDICSCRTMCVYRFVNVRGSTMASIGHGLGTKGLHRNRLGGSGLFVRRKATAAVTAAVLLVLISQF